MKKQGLLFFTLLISFTLLSCSSGGDKKSSNVNPEITTSEIANHIKTLSSDDFGGRAPGTPGGKKAVHYIKDQFKKAGLQPGNHGSWFQKVSMVDIKAAPNTTVTFKSSGEQPITLDNGTKAIVWTTRVKDKVALKNSDLVFVGYGIVAPEYNWNDYKGLDVKGKTVVILVNDPGYETQNPDLFTGNAMTYYGRWTYKYEEASRQGAAAAIVIHETGPAGYPWKVVTGSWMGDQYHLAAKDKNMGDVKVEGWITHEFANKLLQNIGMTYKEAKEAALKKDFKPIPLNATMSTTLNNTITHFKSRNVIGMIKGSKRPDETVVYTAHWDHLGTDPTLKGDQIYNGALDNASGVSGLIAIAQKFASLKERPARTVIFLAVTAEESGLLGSKYYANNPIYPLGLTVADINMDMLMAFGKTKDVVMVGYGMNELQDYLEKAVKKQGRYVVPDPHPEAGGYFRSDHFSFAKKGVPALYIDSGVDMVKGGKKRGEKLHAQFVANNYHKPSDEYNPDWDMSGMKQNFQLLYHIGYKLANSDAWPGWSKKVSFRKIRQKTADMRK